MGNIKVFDGIKKLFSNNIKLKNNINSVTERTISPEHGFQLTENDFGAYLNNFLFHEQKKKIIDDINNMGYMDPEVGITLKNIIDDQNYDTYIKSVHSNDADSITSEGIRCLGTSTSGYNTVPNNINDVSLENTITRIDDLTSLVRSVKSNFGLSQGGNIIDGTIIMQIPRGIPKEELLYYNEQTNTFNIKPEFIVGFLPVNENHIVGDFIYNNKDNNKTM